MRSVIVQGCYAILLNEQGVEIAGAMPIESRLRDGITGEDLGKRVFLEVRNIEEPCRLAEHSDEIRVILSKDSYAILNGCKSFGEKYEGRTIDVIILR
jgi:hypothetical protein